MESRTGRLLLTWVLPNVALVLGAYHGTVGGHDWAANLVVFYTFASVAIASCVAVAATNALTALGA